MYIYTSICKYICTMCTVFWAYCYTVRGTGLFIRLFERNSMGISAKKCFVSPGN